MMAADKHVNEKTAVYSLGDLARENASAGRQMDDDTRELPLISGRFAGREWDVQELRREEEIKRAEKKLRPTKRLRVGSVIAVCAAVASFALLSTSLMGEAEITRLNDRAVAADREITALRQEDRELELQLAMSLDMAGAEEYASQTLGMQRRRQEQVTYVTPKAEDRATVLAIRRGGEFDHFCRQVIDTLGACFH